MNKRASITYVALALGTGGQRGHVDAFPRQLKHTPKFSGDGKFGDVKVGNYIFNIFIYIKIKFTINMIKHNKQCDHFNKSTLELGF